jgi:hypothetical protein
MFWQGNKFALGALVGIIIVVKKGRVNWALVCHEIIE